MLSHLERQQPDAEKRLSNIFSEQVIREENLIPPPSQFQETGAVKPQVRIRPDSGNLARSHSLRIPPHQLSAQAGGLGRSYSVRYQAGSRLLPAAQGSDLEPIQGLRRPIESQSPGASSGLERSQSLRYPSGSRLSDAPVSGSELRPPPVGSPPSDAPASGLVRSYSQRYPSENRLPGAPAGGLSRRSQSMRYSAGGRPSVARNPGLDTVRENGAGTDSSGGCLQHERGPGNSGLRTHPGCCSR